MAAFNLYLRLSFGIEDLEKLSQSLTLLGDIPWRDEDKVKKIIEELPTQVAQSEVYQNAIKNSDSATARIESDAALSKVILAYMTSNRSYLRTSRTTLRLSNGCKNMFLRLLIKMDSIQIKSQISCGNKFQNT